jgi:uncharacterized protein (TIGR02453 family)
MPKKSSRSRKSPVSRKASSPVFQGFPSELFKFLRDLAKHNDREWFAENKQRYEDHCLAPSLAFIEAMQPHIRKLSPYLTAIPKRVGGSLMRIYRDTRFSKNKAPYKTNIGIHFRHEIGGDVHAPGLYLHLEPGACFVGVGIWMPPNEALTMIRQLIDEDSRYWKKSRDDKRFAARFKLDNECLKTAPRGYDPSHPMIDDLRRKSFAAMAPISEKELANSQCVASVVEAFKEAKPFMKFLCDALNQPF